MRFVQPATRDLNAKKAGPYRARQRAVKPLCVAATALLLTTCPMLAGAAQAQSGKSLSKCQATLGKEAVKYARAVNDALDKCLQKASSAVLAKGGGAGDAAAYCVKTLTKLVSTGSPSKTLAGRFNDKVAAACDPAVNTSLAHSESEIYTVGPGNISANNIGAYCSGFGGNGSISDFDQWRDCVRTAADCEARQAVANQYPRALEYTEALLTAIAALPSTQDTTDALTALGAVDTAIEGASDDNVAEIACGTSASASGGSLPRTGQTTCSDSSGGSIPCAGTGQDGELQKGLALSYTDNGFTITDNATGLTWEKLCLDGPPYALCPEVHSELTKYNWSAAFGKIAALNGAGFGGFNDWRLPNRRELFSLVDAGRWDDAVNPGFAAICTQNCSLGTCNCPGLEVWSSTTNDYTPANAMFVDFRRGDLLNRQKTWDMNVRAVRGP